MESSTSTSVGSAVGARKSRLRSRENVSEFVLPEHGSGSCNRFVTGSSPVQIGRVASVGHIAQFGQSTELLTRGSGVQIPLCPWCFKMTHEYENEFARKVGEYLIEQYGEENVEQNKYFSESRRYVDFWVDAPVVSLAIEVENDFDAVMEGVGQSLVYAGHEEGAIPLVIVPEDHVEHPEVDYLRETVRVIEM